MRRSICLLALLAAGGISAVADSSSAANNRKIAALDNCDPNDPNWAPPPGSALGCANKATPQNNVRNAEFNALIMSPLSLAVIGHPSWRFDPGYLTVEAGQSVRMFNDGGRPHTFTRVTQFGGGRVPPLNNPGLQPAPECALAAGAVDPDLVQPGESIERTLPQGEHRMQCCFHPWMRLIVKVEPKK